MIRFGETLLRFSSKSFFPRPVSENLKEKTRKTKILPAVLYGHYKGKKIYEV
jgi:hypothetical protein